MNTRQNKRPKLNAEAAYENGHLMARDLLERIGELLIDMPAPGDDEHPINWCDVGSITEVNSRLNSIIAFLTNTER
jgi:hypothetical protein